MKSFDIVTLTVNPAIDKSTHLKGLVPEQKIRCEAPRFDAGGGGINVSKAISRLGGTSLAPFTAGGFTGKLLEELINKEGISSKTIEVEASTRENFIAVDDNTNSQYRFGFPGGKISEEEAQKILNSVSNLDTQFLVVSGSLNEGLSDDFYQEIAKNTKAKLIIDTSGEALKKVLKT
ncbi:MAG: phosphofructokinase, partial [Flavobacteriales bacterium 32-34-25]